MNKIKLACVASILLSGIASAAPSCDSFQIRLKNNLADDLEITKIKLSNAQIQPGTFAHLKSKTEQVFTVNGTTEGLAMYGQFTMRTLSLPSKTVKVKYNLENTTAACVHTDRSPQGDYALEKTRTPGEVQYSINNQ